MSNESTQQMLVNGKCEDIYYANPESTKKECIRTKTTTKYVQSLTQLSGGTSVFLVPPQFGLQDVVLTLQRPAAATGAAAGLAIPRGWGYALIKNISYRVGGSTQFFVTGQQLLQHALKRCANGSQRDDLFALGGAQAIGAEMEAANAAYNPYAYVWLDVPWTRPTSEGKPVPLPSDILSSQVQITVELNPLSSIISNNGGTIPANFIAGLASGQFQIQQVLMESRDDSLASRSDMATHQYTMPVEFVQQEQVVSCANTAAVQTIVATGFRSGSLKSIEMWLTKDSNEVVTAENPLKWIAPSNVQVTYAGDVYARFDAGSSQLWDLVNSKMSPKVAGLTLSYTGGAYVSTPENYGWVTAPFAQTYDAADTGSYMLTEGISVTNGVINISFSTPTAAADYKLHLSYIYAASAVFSQSTCEFVF
jgi:hypothetical protein